MEKEINILGDKWNKMIIKGKKTHKIKTSLALLITKQTVREGIRECGNSNKEKRETCRWKMWS